MPIYMLFFMILNLVNIALLGSDDADVPRVRKRARNGSAIVCPDNGYDADSDESDIQICVDKQERAVLPGSGVRRLDDDVASGLRLLGHVDVDYVPHPHKSLGQQYDAIMNTQAGLIQERMCMLLGVPVSYFVQKNKMFSKGDEP